MLEILPQALTAFHEYEHLMLGIFIILVMIFLRDGIVPDAWPAGSASFGAGPR